MAMAIGGRAQEAVSTVQLKHALRVANKFVLMENGAHALAQAVQTVILKIVLEAGIKLV